MKVVRVKKNSLSYFILLALEKSVDGYVRFEDFTYHHYRYKWGIPELKKSELSQAFKRLRERGLIIKENIDTDKIVLKLTEIGREALGEDVNEEWDGKYRIVIFDIPEQKRVIRNLFRRRLIAWGFKRWQQSVWITKRNVTKKLRLLIADLKIDDWIAVIESEDAFIENKIIDNKLLDGRTM